MSGVKPIREAAGFATLTGWGGGISTLKVNSICCQHQIKNWTLSAAFGLQRMYAISWQLPLVRVSLFFPSIKTTKLVYSLPPLHSLSPVSPNHCQGAYIAWTLVCSAEAPQNYQHHHSIRHQLQQVSDSDAFPLSPTSAIVTSHRQLHSVPQGISPPLTTSPPNCPPPLE